MQHKLYIICLLWLNTIFGFGFGFDYAQPITNYSQSASEHPGRENLNELKFDFDNEQDSYVLEKHGIEEGLNSLHILTLFQASNKFIWAGTDRGLSYFDGYMFKNFTEAGQFTIGSVFAITEDKNGVLWIGSAKGLFYYDGIHVNPTPWKYEKENEHSIKDLLFKQNGDLWVASGRGPFLITEEQLESTIRQKNKPYYSPTLQAWDSSDLCDRRAHCLAIDKDNNLWIGNYFTVTVVRDGQLTKVYDTEQIKRTRVSAIIPIEKDSALVSIRYSDVDDHHSEYIHPRCDLYETTVKLKEYKDRIIGMNETSLFYVGNKKRDPFITLPAEKIVAPKDFIMDHEGHFWVGSESGLAKFTLKHFTNFNHLASLQHTQFHSIHAIDGDILIGGSKSEIYRFNVDDKNQLSLKRKYSLGRRSLISGIAIDAHKSIWLSLNVEGLARIDSDNKINFYNHSNGIADDGMLFITKDRASNLWAGGDGGVTKINLDSSSEHSFINYRYESGNDNFIVVKKGIVDKKNKPWFATTEGLFTISNEQLIPVFQSQLADIKYIYDLILTRDDRIILATGQKGLMECTLDGNGLISSINALFEDEYYKNKNFISLLEDTDQSIWAVNYNEICKIVIDSISAQRITCFNYNTGFPLHDYSKASMHQDERNNMWVIAPNGICNFDPIDMSLQSQEPILFLHNVLIEGDEHTASQNITPDNSILNNTFSYKQNFLSFDFSSISYTNPSNIRYRYFLEGVDHQWREFTGRNTIRYPQLNPGNYTLKVKATNNQGLWSTKPLEYSFSIKPPFWKTIWFYLICALTAIGFLSAYIKYKINQIKQEEAEQHKINKLIAELKIKAIRSQMNPHFIFNCLNSIQACILEQKPNVASKYLTTFAKLLRMVLDYCEHNKISLDKEIEFISLYLSLEKLRFGSDLTYSITVDEELDTEEIKLPSFLIQPFVENSIWHGLMHKEGDRKLSLTFLLLEDTDQLFCEIEDNGIGREKAATLKTKRQFFIPHQSKGMQLSTERIDLIKMQTNEDITIHIDDLLDQHKNPAGTKVSLHLPTH